MSAKSCMVGMGGVWSGRAPISMGGVGRPVGRLNGRVHAYGPLHKDLGAHDLVPKAVQVLFC